MRYQGLYPSEEEQIYIILINCLDLPSDIVDYIIIPYLGYVTCSACGHHDDEIGWEGCKTDQCSGCNRWYCSSTECPEDCFWGDGDGKFCSHCK
jgi:hypothetical protein